MSENQDKNFNNRLYQIRLEQGLSQSDLGKRLAISQAFISSIEKGDKEIGRKTGSLLSDIFGYNLEWILTGNGPRRKEEKQHDLSKVMDMLHTINSKLDLSEKRHLEELEEIKLKIAQIKVENATPKNPILSVKKH